jgi:hypothetical protein
VRWLCKTKSGVSDKKPTTLSYKQIDRLNKIGDEFTEFIGKVQRRENGVYSKILGSATRGEIRAGLVENLIRLLKKGFPFDQQIKMVKATGSLFLMTKSFDIKPIGNREVEENDVYMNSLGLWDELQEIITKDGGRSFEVNETEIRERIVCKLI